MLRIIPEDEYKKVELGKNIEATGYKSSTYEYNFEKCPEGKLNYDQIKLIIKTKNTEDSFQSFQLEIQSRDALLKLKEVIDFALEKGEKNNEPS